MSRPVPRRLAVLFLLALLGVLAAVAVAVQALAGPLALAAYALAVLAGFAVLARQARALVRSRERAAAGRTCTCCTSSQHDPVQVV